MLQWMGGSRKKVSTTRKSIQQRQKQYFEQRRRQQQMSGLTEGFRGGGVGQLGQNSRQQRSLDVVSLANLATVSQHQNLDCFSPVNGKENSASVRSAVDYLLSEKPVVANNISTADAIELEDVSGIPSGYQAETASSNKVFHSPKNNGSTYGGITNKPQLSMAVPEQQYSLIDLLDYDEPNKHLKGKDMRESHVSFSVQGVGKIEAETPPLSPQQPDRYVSFGCSEPLKFKRQSSSSDMLSSELNKFGLEMDAMMQDFHIPLRNSMEFSNAQKDPYDDWKHDSPVMEDRGKFDGHHGDLRTSFSNRSIFGATRTENLFDASGLFDDNIINGGKANTFWKDEPSRPDNNSDVKYEIDYMPDYCFGGSHMQKKRLASETIESYSISEIPSSKHRVSENDHDSVMEDKSRHYLLETDFDLSNKTCNFEQPSYRTEDVTDSLSLLSEESSSSTAVTDGTKRGLLSKSKSAHHRRRQNTFGSPRKNSAKNIFTEGWQEDSEDDIDIGTNTCVSGRPARMPTPRKADLSQDYRFPGRRKPNGSQLFEEGYSVKSAFSTEEIQLSPTHTNLWTEDVFAAWDEEKCADSRVPLSSSNYTDGSLKNLAPAGFISENLSFLQPSSNSFPQVRLRTTTQDFSYELRGRPPDSSGGAVCPRKNPTPDLVARRNEDKKDADYLKFPEAKVKVQREVSAAKTLEPVDSSHCHENNGEGDDAKNGTSDTTTSSVNITDRSESAVDEKASQLDAEVILPCQDEHEDMHRTCAETEGEKHGGRKTLVMKSPNLFVGASSQVMIFQRYAFQLLCVQR